MGGLAIHGTTGTIGELRCSTCRERGLYSRPLLRFTIGAIAQGGEVVARCRGCKGFQKLTAENQHCDGVVTFVVPTRQH